MNILGLCLVVQFCLAFGVFDVLMFPWAASYRGLRANSIAAIGLSILLVARLLAIIL